MTAHRSPSTAGSSAQRCYLVTGAAGFIASKVCEFLLADGHTVVGVDNLNDYYDIRLKLYRLGRLARQAGMPEAEVIRYGLSVESERFSGPRTNNSEQITLKSDRFEFHTLDIENLETLERLFVRSDFSAVFNLAARAGVRYSLENPHVYLSTNTLGTLNVLECMRRRGVKKQVLASTSSLYAGCPMPFTEDQPVNTPLSPYAATKKAAEMLSYSYHQLHGIDTTVARYFTVFGPAGRPDMSIFRFIKWIDEGQPLELFGDGTQSRDFTYVDDIARGTILAGRHFGGQQTTAHHLPSSGFDEARQRGDGQATGLAPQPGGGVIAGGHAEGGGGGGGGGYNVINLGGGRNPISLRIVIAFIEEALGKKAVIDEKAFAPADMKETWADISKAERLLGWKPEVSPEDGFRGTVDWHVANREWLKDVSV